MLIITNRIVHARYTMCSMRYAMFAEVDVEYGHDLACEITYFTYFIWTIEMILMFVGDIAVHMRVSISGGRCCCMDHPGTAARALAAFGFDESAELLLLNGYILRSHCLPIVCMKMGLQISNVAR